MFWKQKEYQPNDEILAEIRGLKKEVAGLRGERDAAKEKLALTEEVGQLRTVITNLEITKSKLEEENERDKRETEHFVGLERKRSEFEKESAQREAVLAVREENLQADRDRFEEQMKFTTARFEQETDWLRKHMNEILTRLPSVSVEKAIDLSYGKNGDAAKEEEKEGAAR
jgi:hypothetical protein